jgi:hypothetical protein
MKKLFKAILVSSALTFTLSTQATIIQDTWTANISSVNDNGSYFTAGMGDSLSFTVTYDDSLHFMGQYDEVGSLTSRYCDRTAITNTMYSDCNYSGYTMYDLFAENISNSAWSSLSGLVGGLNIETGAVSYDWSYSHDGNDADLSNDFDYFQLSSQYSNLYLYKYDDTSSYVGSGGSNLYTEINGVITHLGNVQFDNISISSSADIAAAATAVPEPTGLAIFGLGLLGLAFRRRIKA